MQAIRNGRKHDVFEWEGGNCEGIAKYMYRIIDKGCFALSTCKMSGSQR
jgi:hypothetical protein